MVVIRGVAQVRITLETDGAIFISQEDSSGEDAVVLIWPEHIDALIAGLRAVQLQATPESPLRLGGVAETIDA